MFLQKSMYSPLCIFSDNRVLVSGSKSPNSTPDPREADPQGIVADFTPPSHRPVVDPTPDFTVPSLKTLKGTLITKKVAPV